MKNITVIAKFKLNEGVNIEDWKKMSDGINNDLKNIKGFISRESCISKNGEIYCIVKWENIESQQNFMKNFEKMTEEKPEIMQEFARIADMNTMTRDILEVI